MALIECPQDGCKQHISPTAETCPSCGFDVASYFREDLRGYENNVAMRKYAHWVDNGDGTTTDSRRQLTWIRAPYGMTWDTDRFTGEPESFKWKDATRRFGRGNTVEAFDENNRNFDADILVKNATKEHGYTIGRASFYFAGKGAWRLPTIAEYLSLRELAEHAEGFLDANYYTFFDIIFCRGSQHLIRYAKGPFLSANARQEGQSVWRWTLWHGVEWAYYPKSNGVGDGVIDTTTDTDNWAYSALLVHDH